jgi:hypothetical protein
MIKFMSPDAGSAAFCSGVAMPQPIADVRFRIGPILMAFSGRRVRFRSVGRTAELQLILLHRDSVDNCGASAPLLFYISDLEDRQRKASIESSGNPNVVSASRSLNVSIGAPSFQLVLPAASTKPQTQQRPCQRDAPRAVLLACTCGNRASNLACGGNDQWDSWQGYFAGLFFQ